MFWISLGVFVIHTPLPDLRNLFQTKQRGTQFKQVWGNSLIHIIVKSNTLQNLRNLTIRNVVSFLGVSLTKRNQSTCYGPRGSKSGGRLFKHFSQTSEWHLSTYSLITVVMTSVGYAYTLLPRVVGCASFTRVSRDQKCMLITKLPWHHSTVTKS